MKVLFILCFILLFSPSWGQKKYPNGRSITQPSMDEFRFLDCYKDRIDKAIEKGIIDTSVVYLGKSVFEGDTTYGFQRYFRGGISFSKGSFQEFPTNEDFNDLTNGRWNIYVYNGNKSIIKEMYVNHPIPWRISHYESNNYGDLIFRQTEARAVIFCKHRSWFTGSSRPNTRLKKIEDVDLWNYEIDWE